MNNRTLKSTELRKYFGNVLNLDNNNMLSKNIVKVSNESTGKPYTITSLKQRLVIELSLFLIS